MSKENATTLQVYEELAGTYLDNTAKHTEADPEKAARKKQWLKDFLTTGYEPLVEGASILEIGAGSGEDSVMLQASGFKVTASDNAPAFLEAIKNNGLNPVKFNVLTDNLERKYDGVLAWRVFVHFTKEDVAVALKKVYAMLVPSGRFIFNAQNKATKETMHVGWSDDPGDHHMGKERFFQPYDEEELRQMAKDAGFRIVQIAKNGGRNNDRWLCVVVEKPTGVSEDIRTYIETQIMPQYARLSGHSDKHINQVIRRSLMFAEEKPEVSCDMVYVIAAYHDLGRLVDDETHNIESAKMVRADKNLRKFFSEAKIEIIAEAVEDHRASLKRNPRSIYGEIVSSADRNTDLNDALERVYDIIKLWHPEWSENEIIEDGRQHLREKYTPDGYAAKKMYFKDPDFEEYLRKVEEVTRDPMEYRKMMLEFNKKRGLA